MTEEEESGFTVVDKRRVAPDADGLVWPSKREATEPSLMLFGDRCEGSLAVGSSSIVNLDDAVGAAWINTFLAPYEAWIVKPTCLLPRFSSSSWMSGFVPADIRFMVFAIMGYFVAFAPLPVAMSPAVIGG